MKTFSTVLLCIGLGFLIGSGLVVIIMVILGKDINEGYAIIAILHIIGLLIASGVTRYHYEMDKEE